VNRNRSARQWSLSCQLTHARECAGASDVLQRIIVLGESEETIDGMLHRLRRSFHFLDFAATGTPGLMVR